MVGAMREELQLEKVKRDNDTRWYKGHLEEFKQE